MTAVPNPLRLHRQRAGLTLERLARAVGTTPAQISKLEKGARRLTVDWMARLAPALGVTMADLLADVVTAPRVEPLPPRPGAPLPGGEAVFAPVPLAGDPRDFIPVRSAGRGGAEQEMFLEDGPIDYVRRPPSLALVRDAYAIYVIGDSMLPRFRQGQVLHVNPFMPPRPGSGIVLTKTGGAVLIKEFLGRSTAGLQARQYNPAAELFYPQVEIEAVHTIVGLQEP